VLEKTLQIVTLFQRYQIQSLLQVRLTQVQIAIEILLWTK